MSSSVQPAGSVGSSSELPLAQSTEPRVGPCLVRRVVLPIAAIAALFFVWEAVCQLFAVPSYIIPAPSAIWKETSALPGNVAWHTLVTDQDGVLGFLVSVLVSLPLAVLLTSSPPRRRRRLPAAGADPGHPQSRAGADPGRRARHQRAAARGRHLPRRLLPAGAVDRLGPRVGAARADRARPRLQGQPLDASCGASACPTRCPSSSAGSRRRSRWRWSARWWPSSSTPMPASAT